MDGPVRGRGAAWRKWWVLVPAGVAVAIGMVVLGLTLAGPGTTPTSGSAGARTADHVTRGGADAGSTTSVHVASVPGVGKVLVDSAGATLYAFRPDHHHTPTCYQSCAATWPPLLVTAKPTVGPGISKSLLGTARRHEDLLQVTYHHWPLYTFTGDTGAGHARGNGLDSFGGKWSVVPSSGKVFATTGTHHSPTTTHSSTTTAGSGSGGYGY
ncbi:MAG: COG4315 family predicted lipoprotein [Acidimicrobiales bacterium]